MKSSACVLRWGYYVYDIANDRLKMCCRTGPHQAANYEEDFQYNLEQRKNMLEGKRPTDCQVCWSLEDRNLPSFRDFQNMQHVLAKENLLNLDRPYVLELKLDTTCDLQCVYCGPNYSSRWQKKMALPDLAKKINEARIQKFNERLEPWWPTLHEINFIGGEPLIQESFYRILQVLDEKQSSQEKLLKIVTNLNTPALMMDRFLSWANASPNKIALMISNEAIGELAETIREGLNFSRFDKNLDQIMQQLKPQHQIYINPTLNTLCLKALPLFFEYLWDKMQLHQKGLHLNWNIVSHPEALSPLKEPGLLKEAIQNCQPIFHKMQETNHFNDDIKKSWQSYFQTFQQVASLSKGF